MERVLPLPMKMKWFWIAAAMWLSIGLHSMAHGSDNDDATVTIGVLSQTSSQQTRKMWGPTARFLSSKIEGHRFVIRPLTVSELRQAAQNLSVHYLIINPSIYVDLAETLEIQPILTLKRLRGDRGYSQTGSVIFSRRDASRIRTLDDLVGRTFMAVSDSSFAGWHITQAELRRHGIMPDFDFQHIRFGRSHMAVVMAVRDGLVEAGTVAAGTLETMAALGDIRIESFQILNQALPAGNGFPFVRSTGLYPEWPLAATAHAFRGLSEKVALHLLALTPEMDAAKAARIAGWTPALNYQPVHEAMHMLRQPGQSGILAAPSMGLYALILFLVAATCFGIAIWYHHCKAIPCDEKACMNRQDDGPTRHPHPKTRISSLRCENGCDQTTDRFDWLDQIRRTPLFDSPLTALLFTSTDSRKILAANDRACALLGSSEDELIGTSCDTLGFSFDPHGSVHKNLMLEATPVDGPQLPVKAAFSPIRLADGKFMQISFIENSELATLKKQLRLAKATADAAQTAKGQFLANMNHEIRTPLNGIVSMVELLMQSSMAAEHLEYVGIIQQSTKALVSIVNDVMDYCKIESGRIKIETTNTQITALVANTAQSYSAIAKAKGVGFSCVIDPKLPKWIRCDPIRLRQILENLLDNAAKFTLKGNIHLHVELAERHSNRITTRFQVGDTGIGISEDRLATIFDSFSQGGEPSIQKPGGIGLGLTIAKHLIGLMGGEIQVESTPGQGTRFWFCIDLQATDNAEREPHRAGGTTSGPFPSNSAARILLVEDNAVNQTVADKILTKAGYTFETVENGRLALEQLAKRRYDLILMDIKMPEMDGLETTRRIRHPQSHVLDRNIPIIAVTANATQTDRQQCLDCGMNDYLTKPIDTAKLLETISAWLPAERRRQQHSHLSLIAHPPSRCSCQMDADKSSSSCAANG